MALRTDAIVGLALGALTALACDGEAALDAGRGDAGQADAGRATGRDTLIWFGPHPDDEFYVAPMLGHYCVELGWDCLLVVFTRGEGGSCNLPGGCQPDLQTVREAEMRASAAIFGAELDHWDLGDNGRFEAYAGDVQEVLALWGSRSGGVAALVERVASVIRDRDPTLVLGVDWRHGNYCHPTHRAAGAVVASAIVELGESAPPVQLIASRGATAAEGPGFVPVVASDPAVMFFDATMPSTAQGEVWAYVAEVFRAHPSQFAVSEAQLTQLNQTVDERKRVFFVEPDGVTVDDPLYQGLCDPSTF